MTDGEWTVRIPTPLSPARLEELLDRLAGARVAVIGDFCLDVYWMIDPTRGERSLETGLTTQPVREQRYSLGGAGNVIANLAALGCGRIHALGVVGDDPWGREQRRLLDALGVDATGLRVHGEGWDTLVYAKPHVGDAEQARLDFGGCQALPEAAAAQLLADARRLTPEVDVLIINQQVWNGVHTPTVRAGLAALIREQPRTVSLVDSRHHTDAYAGAWLKINEHEAARLCRLDRGPDDLILREEALQAADALFRRHDRPVILTRGQRGLLIRDADGLREIPGIQILGPVDTVGAGDSLLAGLAAGLAAGGTLEEAAQLGNFTAGVTVQKLRQTGTASPAEIRAIGRDCDYLYRPELAEDPRRIRRLAETDIEVVTRTPDRMRLTGVIFDHDGTLSVLRQGWEAVMEPMMVRAILGPVYATADESLYHRVVQRVQRFIDETNGIQTLTQMHGLVGLVREFGCVPPAEILDAAAYKKIYNTALMERVRERMAKFRRGELAVDDFTIKNAPAFVARLASAGIPLYLASGTDQEDVVAEAEALGYARYFEGRIHGATGDMTRDAKRMVLDRLMGQLGTGGLPGVVVFGDGPVELRECRKRGGYAIGVASDEVRRYGLNPVKRTRLIKAGADLVIPDYSQMEAVLKVLGV